MFDIIFQTTKSCDGTNILLSCFAGNLTIFAFGFPYIYRAISNLSRISIILTTRTDRYITYEILLKKETTQVISSIA